MVLQQDERKVKVEIFKFWLKSKKKLKTNIFLSCGSDAYLNMLNIAYFNQNAQCLNKYLDIWKEERQRFPLTDIMKMCSRQRTHCEAWK